MKPPGILFCSSGGVPVAVKDCCVRNYLKHYINGEWVDPVVDRVIEVVNPATEEICGKVVQGGAADVDRAVAAAREAFKTWSRTDRDVRIAVLARVVAEYQKRTPDLIAALTEEMGAPVGLASQQQAPVGLGQFVTALTVLRAYAFEEDRGATRIVKEPIGVCGFITPWNWPLNLTAAKVAPALATGCTMILKSPQGAPFTAQIIAEIMDAAGVPAGVFNLVHGDGRGVGVPLCEHPGVDMISFTGSTSAGVEVAKNAAATVKRVHQELGGKSPLIILDDEALALGVKSGVEGLMRNSGQTCNAPTRMLVPASRLDEAIAAAKAAAEGLMVGDPLGEVDLGPVASKAQYDKVRSFIAQGVKEGARLVAGGLDQPDGLSRGYFIKPTVFADVSPQMTIAREEIFGPVMSIMTYSDLDEAVELANDTDYGLAAYVNGADLERARDLASRLRAGQVIINGAFDIMAPFGGYKRSGNGREWGDLAFQEFLEIKAVLGFTPVAAA